ncbi:hypothetical protein MPSEU_000230700 [Mayamaea pseudoterrestris]|nr:hypothetical protein MPSEU_000230700 [Mayamaea pseudoterrestris]
MKGQSKTILLVNLFSLVVAFQQNFAAKPTLAFMHASSLRKKVLMSNWNEFERKSTTIRTIDLSTSRRMTMATAATTHDDIYIYDGNVHAKYHEIMEQVMTHSRTVKKLSPEELTPIQTMLIATAPIIDDSVSALSCIDRDDLLSQLTKQQERFKTATSMTPRQFDYYTRCLSYFADVCAKSRDFQPARLAWTKLVESGHAPIENCLSTYMYVFSLDEADESALSLRVAEIHDLLFAPNEKTLTLRIKGLTAQGNLDEAERLLQTSLSSQHSVASRASAAGHADWKRLRTFQPLLSHYCETRQVDRVLKLFRHMRDSLGVYLESQTYADIIKCLALEKCFSVDASPIQTAIDSGFVTTSGPGLFDALLTEMADDLMEISATSAIGIAQALAESVNETLADANADWFIQTENLSVSRTLIDNSTAICSKTGVRLKLFALTDFQRKHVRDTLVDMAASQHEEFGLKLKAKGRKYEDRDGEYARSKLLDFSEWLIARQQSDQPYTAFIDGPNVAYYGHGDIHYSQVMTVYDKLEQMGEKPLIIMPEKYTGKKFAVPMGGWQELSQKEADIVQVLLESEKMYAVPLHCLDDYYWMFASVIDHMGPHQRVPLEDKDGRVPGLRPLVVTNDQMRDHKLALLEPREFRRWTGCHIVNYYFEPYGSSEWEGREIQLYPANLFSREIQSNSDPDSPCERVWHIPVAEWPENERLYIHYSSARQ